MTAPSPDRFVASYREMANEDLAGMERALDRDLASATTTDQRAAALARLMAINYVRLEREPNPIVRARLDVLTREAFRHD